MDFRGGASHNRRVTLNVEDYGRIDPAQAALHQERLDAARNGGGEGEKVKSWVFSFINS